MTPEIYQENDMQKDPSEKPSLKKHQKQVYGQAALAEMLGVTPQRITQWKNGHLKCQPDDLAAIGAIAGYNAQCASSSHVRSNRRHCERAVLDAALGKLMTATGYAKNGGLTPKRALKTI